MWKGRGSPTDPGTYRPITVVHPIGKLLSLAILRRLETHPDAPQWRAAEQAGFHAGHRIEDHQLLITYLMMAAAAGQGPLVVAFLDLEKTYDIIPWAHLWQILAEDVGVPDDLRAGLESLYEATYA